MKKPVKKPVEKPLEKPIKISFCTTCMGRTPHLQETLLKNIEDNLPTKEGDPQVEFVIVDYNSKDGLKAWVEGNEQLQEYIKQGIVVYRQYPAAKVFHHSHAKNMAHRVAAENTDPAKTEHIVCNLDADNFLGKGFARYLADVFADGRRAIVHPAYGAHKDLPDGYWGRIAARSKDFLAIGGYSETRYNKGWGGEDSDFIIRALAYGLKPQPIFDKDFLHVIAHDNDLRVKNTAGGTTVQEIEKAYSGDTAFNMLRKTFAKYALSVQANREGGLGVFGMGTVFGITGEMQELKAIKQFARISGRSARALGPIIKDRKMKPVTKKKQSRQTAGVKGDLVA